MVFGSLLDPVLSPLLKLPPFWTVFILAAGITFLITLAYKYLTDQEEMQRLKDKMKSYQEEIKELQKEDPDKAMDKQKEAMSVNMEYMKKSFKPTLYTFIPIIIIFGWMNSHLGYQPIAPGQSFQVEAAMEKGLPGEVTLESVPELQIEQPTKSAAGTVNWTLSGEQSGQYKLTVKYGDNEFSKNILLSNQDYESPKKEFDGPVNQIRVQMQKLRPLGDFSIFGWHPGWLGTYIILSIAFSFGFRKLLGVA